MSPDPSIPTGLSALQELVEESKKEYDQAQKELKEIDVLIRQTTGEVEKLAQRNAQIATKVRQMEANINTYPRADIKEIYSAAQDTQVRLFMMRSQVEQLQSKQQNLERYAERLRRFLAVSDQLVSGSAGSGQDSAAESGEPTIVRIIEAQENERQHLARQMHDGPAQALTNLILQAEICERLFDIDKVRARAELDNLKNAVTATFQKTRDFIFDLRPMMLDDLGLVPTLKRYIEAFQEKSGVATSLTVTGKERRFAPHTEVTIFRVLQGLLSNVSQHAHATHVQIVLDMQDDMVEVTVEDDGSGFDVNEALASARQRKTLGISTMQERVEMLGGKIHFESSIGRGTKVRLDLPAD